jgi:hypothetical protein
MSDAYERDREDRAYRFYSQVDNDSPAEELVPMPLTPQRFQELLAFAWARQVAPLGPKLLDAQAQERARKMRDTATFD